jgi:hypothetical protein
MDRSFLIWASGRLSMLTQQLREFFPIDLDCLKTELPQSERCEFYESAAAGANECTLGKIVNATPDVVFDRGDHRLPPSTYARKASTSDIPPKVPDVTAMPSRTAVIRMPIKIHGGVSWFMFFGWFVLSWFIAIHYSNALCATFCVCWGASQFTGKILPNRIWARVNNINFNFHCRFCALPAGNGINLAESPRIVKNYFQLFSKS